MRFVETNFLLYAISRDPGEQDKAERDLALSVQDITSGILMAVWTSASAFSSHTGTPRSSRPPARWAAPMSCPKTSAMAGTRCHHEFVDAHPEITQRDLRTKSREIMDAVEHGQSFTVTRDGRRIGELIPLQRRRRFVPRQEFAAMSRNAPAVDLETFRADQNIALDHETGSA